MTLEQLREEWDTALASVLSTPQGRRFVHGIVYGADAGMLDGNAFLPHEGARDYNLGRQGLARWLKAQCERVSPDLWDRLVVEAHHPARRVEHHDVHREPDAS